MKKKIDGQEYRNLIDYGLRNLALYKDEVNTLNVFPVPDGDTGTNMVMTLQNGYTAIKEGDQDLSEVSKKFANAIVFGARGNSGVIMSQFFRGISEYFFQLREADLSAFAAALKRGVESAYKAVSSPAEGTLLTVVREATDSVCAALENDKLQSFDDMVNAFLEQAKISLENTPELLPILKSAGVVDSGGAGIVYIFEGMMKYLNGESIMQVEQSERAVVVDYSQFNEDSKFELGYCTELLIQLTKGKAAFDYAAFKKELSPLGDSIVTSYEDGKVKLHIHTQTPENVFVLGHKYGEFLAIKVENMSVQHHEKEAKRTVNVYADYPKGKFSVLVVAYDEPMKERFMEMGADLVIMSDRLCPPSAADFIEAFEKTTGSVLVFANGKNASLSAEQAAKLYDKAKVVVVETKSDTECYAALPMIDFDCEDVEEVAQAVRETIANVKTVIITAANKDSCFDGQDIKSGELVAISGSKLLALGELHKEVAISAIEAVMSEGERDVITMFVNGKVPEEVVEKIQEFVAEAYIYTEVGTIETEDELFDIVLSFE
ncbi:MAG: DAK2 domain-containing protein [Clostridia bacterium]|nr:DAK2 domain-containing protein [Clostridia bacterium]